MDVRQAFAVLGLPEMATLDEVRLAYRDLAKVWHPDRFVGHPRLQAKAAETLRTINEAKDTLRRHFATPREQPSVHTADRPSAEIRRDKSSVGWTRVWGTAFGMLLLVLALAMSAMPARLESRIEGVWRQVPARGITLDDMMAEIHDPPPRVFVELKKGTMLFQNSSVVIGHYDILDSNRVRFRWADTPESVVLDVEFQSRQVMVMTWHMKLGEHRQALLKFVREQSNH